MNSLRHALACGISAFWIFPLEAQLQLETLGPGSTAPQIVSVRRVPAGQPPHSVGSGYGAGIVIGRDGDDILILTARHVIPQEDRTENIVVGIGPKEEQVIGRVVASDSAMDLAVIGSRYPRWVSDGRWSASAPRMLNVVDQPMVGTRVFAIGCPMGACWAPPLEGRIARADYQQILVRIPYPTAGESGGALVNDRGMIVGVIAGLDDAGLVSVRPWGRVLAWLDRVSVPVNIPRRRLEQTGQIWAEIQFPQFSARARRPDGSRTPVPMAFEFGLRIHPRFDIVAGYRGLSLALRNEPGQLPDGFEGSYRSYGLRYSQPLPFSLGRGTPPAMMFLGFNSLQSSGSSAFVLEAIPDSFDLRTGEQAYHLVSIYNWDSGWSAVAGLRLFLYRGVSVSASRTVINLHLPPEHDGFRRSTVYEFGLGISSLTAIFPLFINEEEP